MVKKFIQIAEGVVMSNPREQEKTMEDYLEWNSTTLGKFVTSTWLRSRKVALYGIDVMFVQDAEKNPLRMEPVIACAGPLTDLIRENPKDSAFRWDGKIWEVLR